MKFPNPKWHTLQHIVRIAEFFLKLLDLIVTIWPE